MSLTTKAEKIEEVKKHIEEYNKALERAEEVKKALEDYDKESINIKFFKKYFNETLYKGETYEREYQKYSLAEPKYDFQKAGKNNPFSNTFNKRLYIAESIELELITTTKTEILTKLLERIEVVELWQLQEVKRLYKIEAINEPEALEALKAVFVKYNAWKLQDELLAQAKYFREPEEEREPLETIATRKQ